jgi:pyridoxal phosphate enzyme (YggS family)
MGGNPADKCKSEALFLTLKASSWVISTSFPIICYAHAIMTKIESQLQLVQERIQVACQAAKRPASDVRLLAVSKTFSSAVVSLAYAAGQSAFGENYIQEAVQKITDLQHLPIEWHCIGPIQSNKSRLVAEHFAWVHTIDRLKIDQRLSEQRPAHLPALQVCIQVNADGGSSKSGVPPSEVLALAQAVASMPRMRLRGLMCIPEPAPDFAAACAVFTSVRALFDTLNLNGLGLDTLSMGMSADLEAAIASGSTLVRVGSAIFGERSYPG